MYKNNFELFNFQEFAYNKNNQIKWFDILYKNKKFFQQNLVFILNCKI
jgi:hypothetical protein